MKDDFPTGSQSSPNGIHQHFQIYPKPEPLMWDCLIVIPRRLLLSKRCAIFCSSNSHNQSCCHGDTQGNCPRAWGVSHGRKSIIIIPNMSIISNYNGKNVSSSMLALYKLLFSVMSVHTHCRFGNLQTFLQIGLLVTFLHPSLLRCHTTTHTKKRKKRKKDGFTKGSAWQCT